MRKGLVLARLVTILAIVTAAGPRASAQLNLFNGLSKRDPVLQRHASQAGRSRIILRVSNPGLLSLLTPVVQLAGGSILGSLPLVDSLVVDVPNAALAGLGNNPLVAHISTDRLVVGAMERTGATIGATAVRQDRVAPGFGFRSGIVFRETGGASASEVLARSGAR